MKNILLKFFFIIFLSTIASNLLAQGPADPGTDPLNSSDKVNQKIIVPQDSLNNKKTDSSSVVTSIIFIETNWLQNSIKEAVTFFEYFRESLNKKLVIKQSFFIRPEMEEV